MKENKLKSGINTPLICRKCGHIVGKLKMKPALQELLNKKNRKETWVYIFLIALATQFIAQTFSDYVLHYLLA